ncbi:glycosyltransferase family 8 protein [Streptococcus macacae]|uniref:Glycosyltransferase family 8 n=1 Tax=Streptococcus macacae NCTC 11558 TaxID=764298 RepID=G5JUE3_9STRE|nr:glycosyltransferase family 8 protein [Streptococcus macacae]EHJ52618.1 glycosyltransferase family 8 [Streptococcus macacae NCTC 11558]SUN78506.1 lipopolysaccharide glycosyltransferase [Streptococcus macacae NCTC 11558]
METLNLLFSIDDHFVEQFKVTLYSVYQTSSCKNITVYILQKRPLKKNKMIKHFCLLLGIDYVPVVIGEEDFKDAPVSSRYPEAIYYRLLAQEYLPQNLEKMLYLDADILCLNDVMPLYRLDIADMLYAAASHVADKSITDLVNKLRLNNFEAESYFNSGVLLMNLETCRHKIKRQDIMEYITKKAGTLLLPDQDILNALYGTQIKQIPDQVYNYDTRYDMLYFARSWGEWNLDWVIKNTVFLHFCGRDKPWRSDYSGRYAALYKYYQHQTALLDKRDK